jgi:hypothetical protein
MATTTPNFGWPVPTSTDLVKNGATAIEALGDAIDASLVDLEGGTTGQVLAKASNADMDFAWVAQDDSNAIQNSIVDAKGDLISATANDTPARLAVGNNGETLVADSSTSTGLRWQGTYEAGKNFLINGGMDIWQRGTSFTPGAFDPKYTADRWQFFVGTGSNTISQETTTVPTGARYALKWVSGAAGGTFGIAQSIETANTIPLAGKAVTVQAHVTGTTGKTAVINLTYSTSTDVNPISVSTGIASSSTVTLTSGTFSTLTVTGTVPANAKTVAVQIASASTFANTENVILGNVQLEIGSVATSFTRAGGTIQGELAACQRYFYLVASGDAKAIANGAVYGPTAFYAVYAPKVSMRTAPTLSQTTGTNYYSLFTGGVGPDPFDSIASINNTGTEQIRFDITAGIAATLGQAGWIITNNAAAFVALQAEL